MVPALLLTLGAMAACESSSAPAHSRATTTSPSVAPTSVVPVATGSRPGTAAACSTGFADWTSWDRHPGHVTHESVSFKAWRITVRGTTVGGGDPFLLRRPEVVARYRGRRIGVGAVVAVPDTGYRRRDGVELDALTSADHLGSLCVGRFDHGAVAAVVSVSTGNNCCEAAEMFLLRRDGMGPRLLHGFRNHGAVIETRRGRAALVSTDWFSCGYESCAGSPAVTVIERYDGVRVRDVTRQFRVVLRREAAYFHRHALGRRRTWLGGVAAWVADECRLGREQRAWREVDALEKAGRLNGPRGWPRNARFVRVAHRDLRARGYCVT